MKDKRQIRRRRDEVWIPYKNRLKKVYVRVTPYFWVRVSLQGGKVTSSGNLSENFYRAKKLEFCDNNKFWPKHNTQL